MDSACFNLLARLSCPFTTFVVSWGVGLLAQGLPQARAHQVRMSPSEDPSGEEAQGSVILNSWMQTLAPFGVCWALDVPSLRVGA